MKQISLRASLTLLLLTAAAVIFAALGTAILTIRLPQLERLTLAETHDHAAGVARILDRITDNIENELKPVARLLANKSPAALQEYLAAIVGDSEIFNAVFVIKRNGTVAALALAPRHRDTQQELLGADFSGNRLFQAIWPHMLADQGNDIAWSDKYLSALVGKHTIGVALVANDYVVIGEVSLDHVLHILRESIRDEDAHITIFDSAGEWLASSRPDPEMPSLGNYARLPAYQSIRSGHPPDTYTKIGNQMRLAGGMSSAKLGWVILSTIPSGMELEPYRLTVLLVIASFIGTVSFSLLLAPFWANRISKPLNALIVRSHTAAEGDYDSAWPARGSVSELNQLSHDLASMVQQIRTREAAMQRSETRLRATLETTPTVAVQWYEPNGTVTFWNKASEALYGYSATDALGKNIRDTPLMFGDSAMSGEFAVTLADIARTHLPHGPATYTLRHRDGHEVHALSTTFAIPGDHGQPVIVCMDVDVSEQYRAEQQIRAINADLESRVAQRTGELTRSNAELATTIANLRRAQDQLVQSEKLAALGNLVAGVAHELNTPIGNGLMAISALAAQLKDFNLARAGGLRRSALEAFLGQVDSASDIATRNLHRAADLITNFKQVAVDQTSAQRRSFDLAEVVNEIVITLLPTLKRTPYRIEQAVPAGIVLDSYPGALGQTLANLINNAVLHGLHDRDTGTIVIAAASPGNGQIHLSVRDNGCGISAEAQKRIFEPFYTTRLGRGGSGLGLHICHNAVTLILGGKLSVISKPGVGTEFVMLLPLTAPPQPAEDASPAQQTPT